jgi:hypothetical protein
MCLRRVKDRVHCDGSRCPSWKEEAQCRCSGISYDVGVAKSMDPDACLREVRFLIPVIKSIDCPFFPFASSSFLPSPQPKL